MIRFKILGYDYVELPDDFDFTFTFNNGLFSFDRMQLNRSGEFAIPVTPRNEALLGFAANPGKSGDFVRQKLAAELHYSGGKIRGTLTVGKKTGGSYSAVFIWGELERLMAIKQSGVLTNSVNFTDSLDTDPGEIGTAYSATGVLTSGFAFYNYLNGVADVDKLVTGNNLSPTVKLSYLLEEAAAAEGVTLDMTTIGAAADAIGVVLAGNNADPALEAVTVTGKPDSTLNFSGGSAFFGLGTVDFKWLDRGALFFNVWRKQEVKVLVALKDCRVRFEADSINLAAVTGTGATFLTSGVADGSFQFIKESNEFELKEGDYFTIVHRSDYFFDKPVKAFGATVSVSLKVFAGDAGSVDLGDTYYLKPNLPEVSMIDLLKTYAGLFHCGIKYTAATNTISFFNYAFDKSTATLIDDIIIDVKSVDRSFLDYARRNRVECKSEDYVAPGDKFVIDYLIQNDSLPVDKTLYTIPFSEGRRGLNSDIIINDFELVEPFKKVARVGTLAVATKGAGETKLKHISKLYENFSITNLVRGIVFNSTTVVVSVKMDVKTFLSMDGEDVFKWRGRHYCCVEASHSGGVSELTLVKI
jgi:hypothetical protein